jgi:BNR repeat protein
MHRRVTTIAVTFIAAVSIAIGTTTWSGSASATGSTARPEAKLVKASHDPYQNDGAQHATEAEPDTLAFANTVVSVFQVGRFESGGGAIDNGWATSTDKGKTWTHGVLPGITIAEGGKWPRVSDPTIAYNAKFGVWLAAGIVIDSTNTGRGVSVNSSKDGIHWKDPVMAEGKFSGFYDKDWIVCDNSKKSPFYGNCYAEADLATSGDEILMVTSTDGGKTWGDEKTTADTSSGLGGQPLVQPDGTVVVPYLADEGSQRAFRSLDGGKSWTASVFIADISDHGPVGMRAEPLPSAEMNAAGKVYVVWNDCRFRSGCSSNDIVMSTSTNGRRWSDVVRIPIDGVGSGADHFDPGIGASRDASGADTRLGLYYYFYPDASCSVSDCKLQVGFISSTNDGKSWSDPKTLAGPMNLSWLAQAGGAMVGDYISCSVIGKKAISVFAVGKPPKGSVKSQDMYSAGPLTITGGTRLARSDGVRYSQANTAISRPTLL